MSIATNIYNQLSNLPFSYGTSISVILENNGKSLSNLPNEDFVFSDSSILRVTNSGIELLEVILE